MSPDSVVDYETERRRIEEEHRRDLDLLEASRRAKLAALEAMRTAEADRAEALAAPSPASSNPAGPGQKARKPRSANFATFDAVVGCLDRFDGEVFDRNDLARLIEPPPERSSLYKALDLLFGEGCIAVEEPASGRSPTRYRLIVPRSQLPRP